MGLRAPSRRGVLRAVGAAAVGIGAFSASASAQGENTIHERTTTQWDGERFVYEFRYDLPSTVTELHVQFEALSTSDVTVRGTENVDREDETTFAWDGDGTPELVLEQRVSGSTVAEGTDDGYVTDAAAFAPTPSSRLWWRYVDDAPDWRKSVTFDGEGRAGNGFAYAGPHAATTREVEGTAFALTVPDGVDDDPDVEALLDLHEFGERRLRSRQQYGEVEVFVLPTDRVGGEFIGRARGSSTWIDARHATLDAIDNVPAHEYCHVALGYFGYDRMYWLTEAAAEYYGQVVSLNAGVDTFGAFRERVRTDGHEDAVLTDAQAMFGSVADYEKGAHVLAALDARLQRRTDGETALLDVLTGSGYDLTVYEEFRSAIVDAAGDEDLGDWLDRHVDGSALPALPDDAGYFDLPETAEFRIDGLGSTAFEAAAGADVAVEATVSNVGGYAGTADAELVVDGEALATAEVDLDAGETTTVALAGPAPAETGEYDLEVRVADRAATGSLTVLEPATYEVRRLAPTGRSVAPGEPVAVSAEVTNVGEVAGEPTVDLAVDGETVVTATVSLEGGERRTVEFTVEAPSSPGEHDLRVAVGDVYRSTTLTVLEPATFEVRELDPATASAAPGETVTVDAEVENVGAVEGEATVEAAVGGTNAASTAVRLDAGGRERISLDVEAPPDPGEYDLAVRTPSGAATGTLTVLEPATFEVRTLEPTDATVAPEGAVTVSAEVANVGGVAGETTVGVAIDDEPVASETVEIEAGATRRVGFDLVAPDEAGTVQLAVSAGESTETGRLRVRTDGTSGGGPEARGADDGTAGSAMPGPGVVGAVGSLGGAAYALSRRASEATADEAG